MAVMPLCQDRLSTGRQAGTGGGGEMDRWGEKTSHKRIEFGIFIYAVDGDLITKEKLFLQLTEEFITSKNNEKKSSKSAYYIILYVQKLNLTES